MKRLALSTLLVVVACGGNAILPGGGPQRVAFRAISERQNAGLCMEGPAFDLALDQAAWRALWLRHTSCQPEGSEPPPLLQHEAGVVAWWKVAPCLGYGVRTASITATGTTITIKAIETSPAAEFCAQAVGGLESFLALDGGTVRAAKHIRFVLNDREVGAIDVPA